uniref:Uncharacterized protein n=1 Tax=Plectus sambesii TaxID=2011161 RepID=A0A914VDW5_9BILA
MYNQSGAVKGPIRLAAVNVSELSSDPKGLCLPVNRAATAVCPLGPKSVRAVKSACLILFVCGSVECAAVVRSALTPNGLMTADGYSPRLKSPPPNDALSVRRRHRPTAISHRQDTSVCAGNR